MPMKSIVCAVAAGLAVMAMGVSAAQAECVKKGAVATAGSEDSAKWYALETMVQAVSWGLWPGFVATNKVEGYSVSDRYSCKPDGGQVTCRGVATFCKK
jgi:hypothetical protein